MAAEDDKRVPCPEASYRLTVYKFLFGRMPFEKDLLILSLHIRYHLLLAEPRQQLEHDCSKLESFLLLSFRTFSYVVSILNLNMYKKLDMRPLLRQVSEGDQEAFKVLFNAYCHRIKSFATRLTRSESIGQECVQDVFMKIWLKREALKSVENFDAFIFTIVRNHVYNILRSQALEARVRATFCRELGEVGEFDEDDALSNRKQLLRKVIDALPHQQRRVFHLCQLQGLKYHEAATLLNISRLTVKTHMQQALRTVRLQLGRVIMVVVGIFSEFL